MEERRRPPARQAVLRLRRSPASVPRLNLERFVPSARSFAAGVALLVAGLIVFALARQTSMFAIRTLAVQGAPPALERDVRRALAPLMGESLLALDGSAVHDRLEGLREVRGVSYDRAFPNTLRIVVKPDRAVAVLRSGSDAWLVSSHGAVLRPLVQKPYPPLTRVWVPRAEAPDRPGASAPERIVPALRVLADALRAESSLLARPGFRTVKIGPGELTVVLRESGLQLRLGSARQVASKLAAAAAVLGSIEEDEQAALRYLDLTDPTRVVGGGDATLNSQVEL